MHWLFRMSPPSSSELAGEFHPVVAHPQELLASQRMSDGAGNWTVVLDVPRRRAQQFAYTFEFVLATLVFAGQRCLRHDTGVIRHFEHLVAKQQSDDVRF